MGLAQAAIGIGATLLSKFLSLKSWVLFNLDTNEQIQGQFPAEDVQRNVGSNWTEINTLNRQNAILQFLNGKTDTLSIQSRFFKRDLSDDAPTDKIETLIGWARVDPAKRRPPLLHFSLGDGLGLSMPVILTSISNIKYGQPNTFGGITEVVFSMDFLRYTKFSLDDKEVTDTRYARAQDQSYYELLAQQEYGDPMLGVIIRQRHPQQLILSTGNIVKLPSIEGVRTAQVEQQSIPLSTAFGRKDTPQKRLRQQFFEKRSGSAPSWLLPPAIAVSPVTAKSPKILSAPLTLWLAGDSVTIVDTVVASPNDLTTGAWTKVGTTIGSNVTTDPFGGTLADSIIEDSSTGPHYVLNVFSGWTTGLPTTLTYYAKAGTRNWFFLGGNGINDGSYFDLSNGTMGNITGTIQSRSITSVGNGWYKCSITLITTAANIWAGPAPASSSVFPSYAGNGTGNVYVYGASASQPKVSEWLDKSGLVAGRKSIQANMAKMPLWIQKAINNLPGLRFDGADDFLTSIFSSGQPETLLMVYKSISLGASGVHDVVCDGGVGLGGRSILTNNTPAWALFAGVTLSVPQAIANGSYICATGIFNTTNSQGWVGGSNYLNGNAGNFNGGGFTIGALSDGSRASNIEVAEVLLYSGALSYTDLRYAQSYLSEKYIL